jgi:hypothetical protein
MPREPLLEALQSMERDVATDQVVDGMYKALRFFVAATRAVLQRHAATE